MGRMDDEFIRRIDDLKALKGELKALGVLKEDVTVRYQNALAEIMNLASQENKEYFDDAAAIHAILIIAREALKG